MTVTNRKHWIAAGLVVLLVLGTLAGCSKFDAGDPIPNVRPETTLSFAPADEDTANYRVRMNWFGWDPDGEISHYWTKWDTFAWRRVVGTDSVFMVSASAGEVTETHGYEYHSFSVKAVDNDGDEDPTPETVSFTAFTIVPDTRIVRGPSGVTGPMVTFEWAGSDRDGVIVGYGYRLFKWEQSTSEWVQVTSQTDLGAETVVANFGPIDGLHRFEVWSVDDAGAADQTPAEREFTCNPELAGPKLYVRSNVFGIRTYRGPVWSSIYNIPTPIFAGERLAFEWVATADSYGGQILGYRHAYDDTSNWPAYNILSTRFNVTPELGRHSLYVSALDNANETTRARIYFDVVEATLDEYILVVDDWNSKEGTPGGWPSDEARNGFWNELLAGYSHIRVEWQPDQNQIGGADQPPDVDALRGASTVIWYADQEYTVLADLFDPFSARYNSLAGYMRVGGNLILSGQECIRQIMYENYPLTVEPSDTTEAASFVRDYLHIESADYSGYQANKSAPWNYGYCFYGDIPTDAGESFDFVPMYIDSVGPSGWPERGKWPFYVYTINPNYTRCGLPGIETVTAFQGTGLEVFEMYSFLNSNFEGVPSSVLYLSGDNHGNTWYTGHPMYYLQDDPAGHNFDRVLQLFGEEKLR
ncbi:hypothetical protein K8S17_05970 [bacterium]|nr:hypothetical protein [bacterium]